MKKVLWLIVCLMTMALSANAQKTDLMRVRQAAVNYHKTTLKAPSTFILTDRYGNKISINSIQVKFVKGYSTEYEKREQIFRGEKKDALSSIGFVLWSPYETEYDPSDSISIYKRTFKDVYKVSFVGESQNSYGGMVSNRHVYYVDECYIVHSDIPFTDKLISKKYSPLEKCKLNNCSRVARLHYNGYCGFSHEQKAKEEHEKDSIKKEHLKHIELGIYKSQYGDCPDCYWEKKEHYLHFMYGDGKCLSNFDKCRLCKKEYEKYHSYKSHRQIECLVCKNIHTKSHKKKNKKCDWCKIDYKLSMEDILPY